MPIISIICGVLLIVIGAAGYGYGMAAGNASITALIPAAFGVLLTIFGAIAAVREGSRKHLMHAAAAIALIGFIIPAGRLISRLGELTLSAAVLSQLLMALVCLLFVLMAIRSFAAARLNG